VSDQNQWPKPGESTPDGGASANQPAPEQGAPSSAAQPEFGQPQQYGASAPEGSSEAPQNPYAAPGQQNPYAAAGYQPYAQRPKTNTMAILSIVFGLGAIPLFFMAILLGPAGAILGHLALGRIKQTGESGRALALTGVIAGWVMAGVWILWIIGLFAFASIGNSYSNYDDYGSGAFIG